MDVHSYTSEQVFPDSISLVIPEDNFSQQTWLRRQVANAGAIAYRNTLSVVIPTALREFFRHYIFNRAAESGAAVALGSVAGYLPCVLQVSGLYRDINNHTYTRWTIIGRIACILLAGTGVTILIAIGSMTSAVAAALGSANFIYTPLRDVIQHYIRLEDNLDPDAYSSRISSLFNAMAYIPNQAAVNIAMHYGSSGLGSWMGITGANVVARSFVNFLGESVDEIVSLVSRSFMTGGEGQAHTRVSPPSEHTWSHVIDRILGAHAGRSSLFSTLFSSAFMTNALLPNVSIGTESGVVGAAAGLAYLPFIFSGERIAAPPPGENAMEMGLIQSNYPTDSASIESVHFINERESIYYLKETYFLTSLNIFNV